MYYAPFREKFPEIAKEETRMIMAINDPELPEDNYFLLESYCNEVGCDCRRVFLNVFSERRNEIVAVIAYGWENTKFYEDWFGYYDPQIIEELKGPVLNTASPQSELAPILLERVKQVLKDEHYVERIKRHYRMFKDLLERESREGTSTDRRVKVGRNDPCPCGSGKKYKKCCLNKIAEKEEEIVHEEVSSHSPFSPHIGRLALMRFEQDLKDDPELLEPYSSELKNISIRDFKDIISKFWTIDNLKEMGTDEIIGKLESFNVEFDADHFKQLTKNYISAIELAEDHYYSQDHTAKKQDEDFIWLAVMELWNRLIPERYNVEMIDELVQDGYKLMEDINYEGLEKWGKAWEIIKSIVPPEVKSVEEADEFMPVSLTEAIFNWCQDFEGRLHNMGLLDRTYFKKRIEYCGEFCQVFPESDSLIIQNMLRAEAESYASLGDMESSEDLFQKLTQKFPDEVWGYIGWGDIYWIHTADEPDYHKAEEIYRMGLANCKYEDDKDILHERLEELEDHRSGWEG